MTNPRGTVIAGVPIVVAEGACLGCVRPLVLVQLPGARIQHDDVLCFACAPTMRKAAA